MGPRADMFHAGLDYRRTRKSYKRRCGQGAKDRSRDDLSGRPAMSRSHHEGALLMRNSSSVIHLLCASATIIGVLGGCGTDASQSSALGPARSVRQNSARSVWTEQELAHMAALTNRRGLIPQIHLGRHPSWMRPGAKKQWLLYSTDGDSGTVDIYNYRAKRGKLYGQITGFEFPYG